MALEAGREGMAGRRPVKQRSHQPPSPRWERWLKFRVGTGFPGLPFIFGLSKAIFAKTLRAAFQSPIRLFPIKPTWREKRRKSPPSGTQSYNLGYLAQIHSRLPLS